MKSKRWRAVAIAGVAFLAALALLGVLLLGVGLLTGYWRTADGLRAAPPTIFVEATYPGANARVVTDALAVPIEHQVNGVEKLVHLRSRCGNDGSYQLAVTFAPGTDLNLAQVLVQNRVALALSQLPEAVKQTGVTVRKKSPAVRTLLVLHSPNGSFDEIYLNNYATRSLRDELLRLPGVGDVALLGERNYGVQVSLDREKLAARGLTSAAVIKALEAENFSAAADGSLDRSGKISSIKVDPKGRLLALEELGNIVVKSAPDGDRVMLRDVARIELGVNGDHGALSFDGHPAVALAVHPLGPDIDTRALDNAFASLLQRLRDNLPDGLELDTAFDFTSNALDIILVDLALPPGASAERVLSVLKQGEAIIRPISGVTTMLAATEDPFAAPCRRPCILAGIAPGKRPGERQQIADEIRECLGNEIPGATVRVNDLAASGRTTPGGYPITFAISDISDSGPESLSKLADRIVQRLNESSQLTDVGVSPSQGTVPEMLIDIDRRQLADLGVTMADVGKELQVALGGVELGRLTSARRAWQITVRNSAVGRDIEALKRLKVANANGQIVPLGAVASIREAPAPIAVERLDLYPTVEIAGNPAPGVTLAKARTLCERIVSEEMGQGFRLIWLSGAGK